MEWKLFDKPHSYTAAWYATLPLADHLNQQGHALRIYVAAAYAAWYVRFRGATSVGDFGAGNGGLLDSIKGLLPAPVRMWGYDLLPDNVRDAQANGRPVTLCNFLTEKVEWPQLLLLTEVVEHLVDPVAFLRSVPSGTYVIATVPNYENDMQHFEHHLWAWDMGGFMDLFMRSGIDIENLAVSDKINLIAGKRAA